MFDQPIDAEVSMPVLKCQSKSLDNHPEIEAQARRLVGHASENQLRLLRVAKAKGNEMEPAGRLAGARV